MYGATTRVEAANPIADEMTPIVRNAWYVACFSGELATGALFARKIAGLRVVLFRDSQNRPVALLDQCPHRSYPLSKSKLDGDDIICGYHGLRFGKDGRCLDVPMQDRVPRSLCVRRFATVEESPLIWIWTGDPALAETTPTPGRDWFLDRGGWAKAEAYLHVRASYVHLHENLLDLSHLTFLHSRTFGTPDYARAPTETEVTDDSIIVRRAVLPTRLPPIYAVPLNMEGKDAARIVTSSYVAPGLSISAVVLQDLTLPPNERQDHHIRTAQLLTPEDQTSLHYHYIVARDFAMERTEMDGFILNNITAAFHEDVDALEAITQGRLDSDRSFLVEHSVRTDQAGVAVKRLLKRLALREADGNTVASSSARNA